MIKLLNSNLKIEGKDLIISSFYKKTTYVEISKIKFIYFRKIKYRYFYFALLMMLLLLLINVVNKNFDILFTLITGAVIIYLSMNVYSELKENNILVIKEIGNIENKIIVLKKKKEVTKKIIATIKNFQYESKMSN